MLDSRHAGLPRVDARHAGLHRVDARQAGLYRVDARQAGVDECFVMCAVEGGARLSCWQLLRLEAFRGVQSHLPRNGCHHA